MHNAQHVDEPSAQVGLIRFAFTQPFDLRQDLELASWRCDDTNHAPRAQAFAAMLQYAFTAAACESRLLRDGCYPASMCFRDRVLIITVGVIVKSGV